MKTRALFHALLMPALVLLARAAEVTPEMQETLGITTGDLPVMKLAPRADVFATVLSSAPLVDLFRQAEAAKVAVSVSAETLARAKDLNTNGELVPAKDVQAARAQATADEMAARAIEDRIALEWGPKFAAMPAADRTAWIAAALAGEHVVVRLSLPSGEKITQPLSARLHFPGRADESFTCTGIIPAVAVDPVYQSRTFLGGIESKDAALPAGALLSGTMELEGESIAGFRVGKDTAVFYLGKAWIYRKTGEDAFERIEIPTSRPVEDGWFVAKDRIDPANVVTAGMQSLLAAETLTQVED